MPRHVIGGWRGCRFRVYDLPEDALDRPACGGAGPPGELPRPPPGDNWKAELVVHGGQYIYDYSWYPGMSAADPATCVFAHTGKVRRSRTRYLGDPPVVGDRLSVEIRSATVAGGRNPRWVVEAES